MGKTDANTEAENVAQQLGNIDRADTNLKAEIERLRGRSLVQLEQVKKLHDWLEGKRHSRAVLSGSWRIKNGKNYVL